MTPGPRVLLGLAVAALLAGALPLMSQAPETSLRPMARVPPAAPLGPADLGVRAVLPPRMPEGMETVRPHARGNAAPPAQAAPAPDPVQLGLQPVLPAPPAPALALLRPKPRPPQVADKARRDEAARRQGMVCGDPALQGVHVGPVAADHPGCGIDDAVRLRAVSGITLSTHALIDCTTARALKAWVEGPLRREVGSRGGGVAQLQVAAHYICRPRNNQRGAKVSEHGRGRAIDIAAIRLRDGSEITVLEGWKSRRDGKLMRRLHAAACGPFGTVLGPESDRFHANHFHFDTARYRSGAYCR